MMIALSTWTALVSRCADLEMQNKALARHLEALTEPPSAEELEAFYSVAQSAGTASALRDFLDARNRKGQFKALG